MLHEQRAHSLEHVGGRQHPGDDLQPAGQHAYRIVDAGERHQHEHQRPGERLRAHAVAQEDAGDDDADRPAGQDQIDEECRQRQAEAVEIEAEERDCQKRHRHHADGKANEAHDHERADEFERPQRADHEIAEIARPHLLEKRHREAELTAKQNVPHQHRGDEHAAGAGKESGILRDVELQKSPHEQLHRRPIDELEQPGPGRAQEIDIAQHHRAHPVRRQHGRAGRMQAHCAASRASPRPRATSRNTSSRVSRP